MKKQIMFVLIGLGLATCSTVSFSQDFNKMNGINIRMIEGKVDSINPAKDVVVIKDDDLPNYETVLVPASQIGGLQIGQEVVAVAYDNGVLMLK